MKFMGKRVAVESKFHAEVLFYDSIGDCKVSCRKKYLGKHLCHIKYCVNVILL